MYAKIDLEDYTSVNKKLENKSYVNKKSVKIFYSEVYAFFMHCQGLTCYT